MPAGIEPRPLGCVIAIVIDRVAGYRATKFEYLWCWLEWNREFKRRLCSRRRRQREDAPNSCAFFLHHQTGRNQTFLTRYTSSHHSQKRGVVYSSPTSPTSHPSRQSRDSHQSQEGRNRSDSVKKATSSDRTGQPDRQRKTSSQFSQEPTKLTDSSPTDTSFRHRQKGDGYASLTSPTSHTSRTSRQSKVGRNRRGSIKKATYPSLPGPPRRPTRKTNCHSSKDPTKPARSFPTKQKLSSYWIIQVLNSSWRRWMARRLLRSYGARTSQMWIVGLSVLTRC